MFRTLRLVALGFALNLAACSQGGDDSSFNLSTGATSLTTSEDETETSDTNTGDEDDGDEIYLDIPDDDGSGNNAGDDGLIQSCKKIDFLFVIDNSGSMADNQAELINSFPDFIFGIQEKLPVLDSIHLGVITTDAYGGNPGPCQKLGALVTTTPFDWCGPYTDGYNYMTENDDLEMAFTCAADVGTSGSGSEQPVEGTIQALEGFLNSPGQCNDGFNRDDAILVVVIITDEDAGYNLNPQVAYEHMMYLEGVDDHVIVLSLTHVEQPNECDNQWYYPSDKLIEFTEMFGNGFTGDICAESFKDFFADALTVIDTACGELPGATPAP